MGWSVERGAWSVLASCSRSRGWQVGAGRLSEFSRSRSHRLPASGGHGRAGAPFQLLPIRSRTRCKLDEKRYGAAQLFFLDLNKGRDRLDDQLHSSFGGSRRETCTWPFKSKDRRQRPLLVSKAWICFTKGRLALAIRVSGPPSPLHLNINRVQRVAWKVCAGITPVAGRQTIMATITPLKSLH